MFSKYNLKIKGNNSSLHSPGMSCLKNIFNVRVGNVNVFNVHLYEKNTLLYKNNH